ncbi:O-antigen ligase family protein [Microbulbifer pacificus]|uniref:O-antigen ligase family protein n=1 Tax=Microbulbifer pacificus TaxID=407164 RepID=A0AAU0MXU9_9GAMM|nr:O-antigen ligase family protein [Microbulbifer pacificus]WOX04841.1 O-antigen ligase family protein [Microbulbifer pacificus]
MVPSSIFFVADRFSLIFGVNRKLFFSLLLIPLALLDIRFSVSGMIVRVSDLYLLGIFAVFWLFERSFWSYAVYKLSAFLPFFLYVSAVLLLGDSFNGFKQVIQWGLVLMWPVCLSYCLRPSDENFLKVFRFFLLVCATIVVFMHWRQGYFVGYKHLGDMKYAFGLFFVVSAIGVKCFHGMKSWSYLAVATILLIASLERKGIVVGSLAVVLFWCLTRSVAVRRAFPLVASLCMIGCIFSAVFVYEIAVENVAIYTYGLDESEAAWHSNLHRMNLLGNGVEIFYAHPWFGVGADQLKYKMVNFYFNTGLALYTHNWYLDFLVEYGLLGVLLFFGVPLLLLRKIKLIDSFDCVCAVLATYCFVVPVFMANGTTSMLIWLTSLGLFLCLALKSRLA